MPGKSGRRIVVEFIGEDRSLSSTARKVEGTTGKLGGRLSKVGVIAGGVFAAGVGLAAKGLYEAGKAAIEDQASAAKLATQLKNTTGATKAQVASVEDWISAQGRALGVADDDLRPALSKLATATGDVGKAQKLASLAMDVSAGTGKSLESVSMALAKAQNGNTAGLGKLGIATKDAAGHALTFEQIQKNLASTFKGQAATSANTLQGRIQRLKLGFSETVEAIGYKLLPVAEKFAGWVVDVIPKVSRFAKDLQGRLGPAFAKLKPLFASVTSTVKSVVSIVTSLWKRFGGTMTKYAEGTWKNIVAVIGGALKVISGVFKVFASLLKGDWKGVWDGLKQIASGAWSIIKGVVSQGWNIIKAVFSAGAAAIKGIFSGMWSALKSAASSAWSGIKSIFSSAWSGLKSIVSNGISGVVSAVKSLPGKIGAVGSAMRSAGKALMDRFLEGISKAAGFVGNFASGVWAAIKRLINSGIDKINGALDFTLSIAGAKVHINAPNIPHLYRGGIVKGSKDGTPIVAGDRGRDEAIVPLSGPHAPRFGGGGVTIIVNGVLTEREAGREIAKVLIQWQRSTGRPVTFA